MDECSSKHYQCYSSSYPTTLKGTHCIRIGTQRNPETENNEGTQFPRYLPTDTASTRIRSALLNADTTRDAQIAGVGTTEIGYVIRFRDPQSAEVGRKYRSTIQIS